MSGDPSTHPITRNAHGSYVQLNTFDDKESDGKNNILATRRYKRFLCTKRDIIIVSTILIFVFIIITTTLIIGLPKIQEKKLQYYDTSFPESSSLLHTFDQAVVVTDGQPCATIGKTVLKDGGSAVDAAIATLFCDGVVNPQSMGLGGGFFMTIYIKATNTSEVIDARETAPLGATKDMFNSNGTLSVQGGLSIGVPGELKGYAEAFKRYGKLEWKRLVEPSIKLCNEGFVVSAHLSSKLELLKGPILNDESMRKEFFNNETQNLYKEGEILKRPVLGSTLTKIADEGADVLYTGSLHKLLLKDIAACGGILNASDLSNYQPKIKPAFTAQISNPGNLTFYSVPPPGSGIIISFILNILQNYNMTSLNFENVEHATLNYHRIVEAFKFAFAHRTQLGDDAFLNINQLVSNLKSNDYAESIWKQISDLKTFPSDHYKPVMENSDDHGTAQVSVVAPNGDAVSATSTVNTYFGSLCRSSSTGIILNNVMDDFSSPNIINYFGIPPSPANYIEPGKRPLSSMCPAIVVNDDGTVKMVIGGAGGTRMISASALSMIRMLWLSENVKQATDAPRLHHQLFPNYIEYEDSFPEVYLDKLRSFGHKLQLESQASIFLGIVREHGKWTTNVDHRKGGSADGF